MSGTNSITGQGTPPPPVGSGSFPVPEFVEEIDVVGRKPTEPPLEAPDPDRMFPDDGVDPPSSPSSGGVFGPIVQPQVPVAVAPPAAERPDPPPGPIKTGFGPRVDAIVNSSPTLRKIWAQAQAQKWQMKETTGRSHADHKGTPPTLYISKKDIHPEKNEAPGVTASRLASLISHEIGHTTHPASDPPLRGNSKEDYVDKNVARDLYHEGVAAFVNMQARAETLGLEEEGITPRGSHDREYIDIYLQYLADGDAEAAMRKMGEVQGREPEVIDSQGNVVMTRAQAFEILRRQEAEKRFSQ